MGATQVGGFEIVGELARGGMGVVYRARDPRDGRPVALKLLLTAKRAGSPQLRRFEREADALRRLSHPNIVGIVATGEEQGVPFLALELVEGGSLEERLARGGPLPPREAATLVLALARALEHVHALGIVHRDLKPANVLLDRAGAPKLTDFGIIKDLDPALSQLTQSGTALGSPGYWAPEQCGTGEVPVGPGTDVHGLGAILYAALTGNPPYQGSSMVEVMVVTKERMPPAPSRVRPGIDRALDELCLRCLAKDPLDRYSDCRTLASALEAWLAGRSPTRERRSRRRGRRVALAVLVTLAVVVATVTAALLDRPAPAASVAAVDSVAPVTSAPASPSQADALVARGRTRLMAGDVDAAIADFTSAVELDPRHLKALSHRAFALLQKGDRRAAIVDYTAALAVDPRQVDALYNRAMAREAEGDADGALADLGAVIEIDPGHAEARFERGLRRGRRGDVEAALADFSAILEADPKRVDARYNRGLLRERMKDLAGALADYTAALEVEPRHAPVRANRGSVLNRLGDHDGALADLAVALSVDPRDDLALHNRGLARQMKGDLQGALEDFNAALAIRPTFLTHYVRGHLYRIAGDPDAAARDFSAALALDPEHALADELRRAQPGR